MNLGDHIQFNQNY